MTQLLASRTVSVRTTNNLALVVICAAQLMIVLDGTIVTIALPAIRTELGIAAKDVAWIVNSYALAVGGLLLLGGRLGDLLGRRRVFLVGVGIFAAASLFGGLAQSGLALILARVLQGAGAAVAAPAALALLTTTFAGPARNRALGVYSAMSAAGAAIGLILGGALTEMSWRWTFFINVPIGLVVMLLAPRCLDESQRQSGRFDLPGAVTATAGLAAVVYGLSENLWWLLLGIALLVAFVVIESKSSHPLLPLRVIRDRNRAVGYAAILAVGATMAAMFYFLSLYVQGTLGYSAIVTGVAFLPFAVGIGGAAQLAGVLVARFGARTAAAGGALVAAAGLVWMTRLDAHSTYWLDLFGPMVVIATGLGLAFLPLTLVAVSGVAKADSGVASAVVNTVQQVGGAVGLALLATLASGGNYAAAYAGGAVILLLAAGLIVAGLRR